MSTRAVRNDFHAPVSRRVFLSAGSAGLAYANAFAMTSAHAQSSGSATAETGPYNTFRGLVEALESRGLALRIPRVDQDAYEGTAIMFRLIDEYGLEGAPVLIFDEVKINGTWRKGPVVSNVQGHWHTEALALGLEPAEGPAENSFRLAKQHLVNLLKTSGGNYPNIAPVGIDRSQALCKEVVLAGDDIDLTSFAFLQINPAGGGRYINTASVFTSDPVLGVNFGTYRCQLLGPRKMAVTPGEGQTGWRMLMAAKERGEQVARISVVLGQEPLVWLLSGSRVSNRRGPEPVDELAIVGGLRGTPVEVVRSETNDLMVPAHSEIVIEGTVPLDDFASEGPYGEMFGYQGAGVEQSFYLDVETFTHRREPWIHNSFTGIDRGLISAPSIAQSLVGLQRFIPQLVDFHYRNEAKGVLFMAIDKNAAGQGIEVGKRMAELNPVAKIVVVLDGDVDLISMPSVLSAMGARWQPHPATHIYEDLPGIDLDPSAPVQQRTSKIVIDATRQWPEEGGPEHFAKSNRTLLVEGEPGVFDRVDEKFGTYISEWSDF